MNSEETNNQHLIPTLPAQKTNYWMIFSLLLITALLVVGGVFLFISQKGKNNQTVTEIPTAEPTRTEPTATATQELSKESIITSVDNVWDKYLNYNLGFSLKIPKNMVEFYGSCYYNDKDGDHSYRPKEAVVPVKIFESDNKVYLASEYRYVLSGETKGVGRSYFSKCDKVSNSVDVLKDRANYLSPEWIISVNNITNDSALDNYLKERYGSGCSLGEKIPSKQSGVFEIRIKGDGLDLEVTKCSLNYVTVVKYNPTEQKEIDWDMGQACSFFYPTANNCLDTIMRDSFRFE